MGVPPVVMAGRPLPSPDFSADPAFGRLKQRIIERTGHFYYQDKDALLWERLAKRFGATRRSGSADYMALLADPNSGPAEWASLEAEITIGETFFFRYAEQFAALRETVLPDLVQRRAGSRRLRIWSAGCSTGAEPYSIAILVREILGSEVDSWRVSIIGTDVSEAVLATAQNGRFGKWALRAVSAEDRARYFIEESANAWRLRPEFRAMVRFQRHNLLSLLDGDSPLHLAEFDLILCRNVLIYFHPEMIPRIAGALAGCLADGGWLLLGHAEGMFAVPGVLRPVAFPGAIAYRRAAQAWKSESPPEAIAPGRATPLLEPPPPPTLLAADASRPADPPTPERPPRSGDRAPRPGSDAGRLLSEALAHAQLGDPSRALSLCREALIKAPASPVLHFYEGLFCQLTGRADEAETAFRKALYLDKSFAMAHYWLGLVYVEAGKAVAGRRSIANAARIASALPPHAVIPEGAGLLASELAEMARVHLSALPSAPNSPSIGR